MFSVFNVFNCWGDTYLTIRERVVNASVLYKVDQK